MQVIEPALAPDLTPIFAALGDRTGPSLLATLSDGRTRSITMSSDDSRLDSRLTCQAVTKHLRVLEGAGPVTSVRQGRESLYACRPEPLDAARAYLDGIASQWDDALARLKAFVET